MNLDDAVRVLTDRPGRPGGRVVDALSASKPTELAGVAAAEILQSLRDKQPDQLLRLATGGGVHRGNANASTATLGARSPSQVARRFIDSLVPIGWVLPRARLDHARDRRLQLVLRAIATAATTPARREDRERAWTPVRLAEAPDLDSFGAVLALMLIPDRVIQDSAYQDLETILIQIDVTNGVEQPKQRTSWVRPVIAQGRTRLGELGQPRPGTKAANAER